MAEIIAIRGEVILIDDDCYESLASCRWLVNKTGYAIHGFRLGRKYRETQMSREIVGLPRDDRRVVDHKNGNTLDNRRCNLRVCTHSQNSMNRQRPVNNTSGFKGVTLHKKSRKWQAAIHVRPRRLYLGQYPTPEEAHEVYCLWADMIYGEFANYGTHEHEAASSVA